MENIGENISHYKIISAIGAGGMGEVYKAHDSRLDREVAIKVLPSELSSDEDRLRRFEQEAKATSATSASCSAFSALTKISTNIQRRVR
jgi:serine/threonine protein kinase